MRFSLANLCGAVFAASVFCGLLRFAFTTENYLIVAEMIAGSLIATFFGFVWICENRESVLHKVVVTILCAVLLADALGIITLAYSELGAALEYFAPEWITRGSDNIN